MRIAIFTVVFLLVNVANGFSLGAKKKAVDQEGNCVPELLTENARLYGEVEVLNQIANLTDAQLAAKDAGSKKLGVEGLKNLNAKAKGTRKNIRTFRETYGDVACKAQTVKNGKAEVMTFKMAESATSLDKLAADFEASSDKFLKHYLAIK